MPTVNEFWEVASQVASERGGLVVGFAKDAEQPELGSALDNVFGFAPKAPATVISLSDWADWVEQVEAFYRLRPDWGRAKRGAADANYYRVRFDEFEGATNSASSTAFGASPPFSRSLAGFLFALLLAIAAGGRPPAWVLQRVFQRHFAGFVAGILGVFAYHVICTSIHGSTAGKLLLRMQVIQDDGSPCRPKSAIVRELGYFVDALFFGLIGYFAMHEDPEQKRLGDGWADTIVCKRAQVPSTSKRAGMRFVLGLLLGITADIALVMTGLLIQMNS
jgi:uncharacterized RDD family membrane protein YckC